MTLRLGHFTAAGPSTSLGCALTDIRIAIEAGHPDAETLLEIEALAADAHGKCGAVQDLRARLIEAAQDECQRWQDGAPERRYGAAADAGYERSAAL
jgi:hypothetical protein